MSNSYISNLPTCMDRNWEDNPFTEAAWIDDENNCFESEERDSPKELKLSLDYYMMPWYHGLWCNTLYNFFFTELNNLTIPKVRWFFTVKKKILSESKKNPTVFQKNATVIEILL